MDAEQVRQAAVRLKSNCWDTYLGWESPRDWTAICDKLISDGRILADYALAHLATLATPPVAADDGAAAEREWTLQAVFAAMDKHDEWESVSSLTYSEFIRQEVERAALKEGRPGSDSEPSRSGSVGQSHYTTPPAYGAVMSREQRLHELWKEELNKAFMLAETGRYYAILQAVENRYAPPVAADQLELARKALAHQATLTERDIIEGGVDFILGGPGEAVAADLTDGDLANIHQTLSEAGDRASNAVAADIEGRDCAFCGKPCDNLAADPGQWMVEFPHSDGTGVCKPHHMRCVTERLDELARLRAAVPVNVREAAVRILDFGKEWGDNYAMGRGCTKPALTLARYIASIAEPAAGKQLADIHYNPQDIHDGPP